MNPFVHLRVHSDFSLSEGASKPGALLGEARRLGMPALGLADVDHLFGAYNFSYEASKAGMQALIGCEFHSDVHGKRASFTLIAQDEAGYVNLCTLAKLACFPDANGKVPGEPSVPWDALETHAEGLVMLTGGGRRGLLPYLLATDPPAAAEAYTWLLSIFCDRLYVEICRNGAPGEAGSDVERKLLDLAHGIGPAAVPCADGVSRSQAPIVATSEIWYATADRHEPWLLVQSVNTKKDLILDGGVLKEDDGIRYHLRSPAEMGVLFADLPEAYRNASEIARRCAFTVGDRSPMLPTFPCDGGKSEAEEMRSQAREGLAGRLARAPRLFATPDEYAERLEYELGVIENMGFPGYFLIVSDFIKWAKSRGINVGPGRGSGAGSLVAWSLSITDLDPCEFGLLFERFLNPDRVSMPDFDIDFCVDRRGEVISYVRDKYGSDRVAMIATFTEAAAKTSLKDAGRRISDVQYNNIGFGEMNDICKLIPDKPGDEKTLADYYRDAPEFRARVDSSPKVKSVFDRAVQVEGLRRQSSTHAAGIVIAAKPIEQLAPVHWSVKEQMQVCSFEQKGTENTGLVKFDFLGLKNLSVMQLALSYIKQTRGIDLDIALIPKDDAATYAALAAGRTNGVFQLEGDGMTDAVRKMNPTRLDDIVAVVALYRPGPMDQIDTYSARKRGEHWEAPHPSIQDVLAETYGIMVYQEQVMTISRIMAGYSLGAADLLRRAMGKKIRAEMDKQRGTFVQGCQRNGIPEGKATEVFDLMAKFADYGFNKSHAAAYGWVAYQTAWLKVNYPVEYLSALLSYNTDNKEKLAAVKDEMDDLGLRMLPPDINRSYARFVPERLEDGEDAWGIRFGLAAVDQIKGDLSALEQARDNGVFTSLEHFHKCAVPAGGQPMFNKGQLERLAAAGCFDLVSQNRRQASDVLCWLLDHRDRTKVAAQGGLFGEAPPIAVPREKLAVTEWGDVREREFNAVGFYFGEHPIDQYRSRLFKGGVRRRSSFEGFIRDRCAAEMEGGETPKPELKNRKLCVLVSEVKPSQSQSGTNYLRVMVTERNDSYVALYFPPHGDEGMDRMRKLRGLLDGAKATRKPIVLVADLVMKEGKNSTSVFIRDVWDVDQFVAGVGRELRIIVDPMQVRGLRQAERASIAAAGGVQGEEARRLLHAAYRGILDRKLSEIASWLDQECDEVNEGGVSVKLCYPGSFNALPGRYRLPADGMAFLKMMDGVVDVQEAVDGAATPSEAVNPAPLERLAA